MPQTHRIDKVNQLIRQELSDLLLRETKDPRLSGYISINAVSTTPDLRYARVLVSCVCDEIQTKRNSSRSRAFSRIFPQRDG